MASVPSGSKTAVGRCARAVVVIVPQLSVHAVLYSRTVNLCCFLYHNSNHDFISFHFSRWIPHFLRARGVGRPDARLSVRRARNCARRLHAPIACGAGRICSHGAPWTGPSNPIPPPPPALEYRLRFPTVSECIVSRRGGTRSAFLHVSTAFSVHGSTEFSDFVPPYRRVQKTCTKSAFCTLYSAPKTECLTHGAISQAADTYFRGGEEDPALLSVLAASRGSTPSPSSETTSGNTPMMGGMGLGPYASPAFGMHFMPAPAQDAPYSDFSAEDLAVSTNSVLPRDPTSCDTRSVIFTRSKCYTKIEWMTM